MFRRIPRAPDPSPAVEAYRAWWVASLTLMERVRDDIDRLYLAFTDPTHPLRGMVPPERFRDIGTALGEVVNELLVNLPPCPIALPDPLPPVCTKGGRR